MKSLQKSRFRRLVWGAAATALLVLVLVLALLVVYDFGNGATIAAAANGPGAAMEGVVELEPANYGQFIGQSKYVFVELYTTWCGHCQRFAPVFERLALMVQQDAALRDKVILCKMDSGHIRELASAFGVTRFPSLFLVQALQKVGVLYTGRRTGKARVDYLGRAIK